MRYNFANYLTTPYPRPVSKLPKLDLSPTLKKGGEFGLVLTVCIHEINCLKPPSNLFHSRVCQ
jgi:hypothetical protein